MHWDIPQMGNITQLLILPKQVIFPDLSIVTLFIHSPCVTRQDTQTNKQGHLLLSPNQIMLGL